MNSSSFITVALAIHHSETGRMRSSESNIMEIDKKPEGYITYESLTLDQKIGLKNEFVTNPKCDIYRVIQRLWNCKVAIEFFLNDDPNILQANMMNLFPKENE